MPFTIRLGKPNPKTADELRWVGDIRHARINAEARYLERKLEELGKWAEDEADAVIEARTA